VSADPLVPMLAIADGVRMPQVGYGVYKIPPDEVVAPVRAAIDAGYRLIDTATLYANEAGVGEAVASCGVPREELFITTKLWNTDHGYDAALRAFDRSLAELSLEYVDLYLIHWPLPARDLYVETWRALERIHAEGRSRSIGVSNFNAGHLQRLLGAANVPPAVNQIELHPGLPQTRLRALHGELGITTQAWSPLGQGKGLLGHPVLTKIAAAHGRTAAQVVLRWCVQLGVGALPRSVRPERMAANLDVFDFELSGAEVAALTGLGDHLRIGPDPEVYGS
jgi:2,5-diketo-D-gluconate reductase A